VQDNRNISPPLDVGPSLARTRINLCVFLESPSGKGSTHISFTRWCDPPGGKHRQLARQVGVLRVFSHRLPISFQMATLISPIPSSTVIWFGSLEFMSTGFGYDMILLSVKGPRGARIASTRLRAPRQPHHHASPPMKRRGRHRHHSSASSRSSARARRAVTQEPTTPRAGAAGTTARRHENHATTLGDDAPCALSSPTTLLLHGLFAPIRALSFGLENTVASLARTICPNAQTYVERPMVLPRDAGAQQQASELPEFSQV